MHRLRDICILTLYLTPIIPIQATTVSQRSSLARQNSWLGIEKFPEFCPSFSGLEKFPDIPEHSKFSVFTAVPQKIHVARGSGVNLTFFEMWTSVIVLILLMFEKDLLGFFIFLKKKFKSRVMIEYARLSEAISNWDEARGGTWWLQLPPSTSRKQSIPHSFTQF